MRLANPKVQDGRPAGFQAFGKALHKESHLPVLSGYLNISIGFLLRTPSTHEPMRVQIISQVNPSPLLRNAGVL